ncbi:MAG: MbnP family copper-binding protein [Myxococcota bacterium]
MRLSVILCALSLALPMTGCGDDDDPGPADANPPDGSTPDGDASGAETPVTLNFAAKVGDMDFSCGTTYSGLGTANSDAVGADFRFYVSNIRLVNSAGTEVPVTLEQDGMFQREDVALLDFEDGSADCMMGNSALRSTVVGTVAEGDYNEVRFTMGIPFSMNHQNVADADSPFNISGMFWVWQGGYKFLRIDLGVGAGGYNVHLGSTMCSSGGPMEPPTAECGRPNRADVSLTNFDIASSVIVADLAPLVADADLTMNTDMTPPGCQSFPNDEGDCGPVFPKLGLDFQSGMPGATPQSFFRLE